MKEGPGAESVIKGVEVTVEQMLPIDEAKVIADPTKTGAEKLAAGFMATSKVASLVALGAGVTGKNPVITGLEGSVGVGFAGPGVGHTGATTGRGTSTRFFDKVVGRDGAGKVRSIPEKPESFPDKRPFKYSEVEVPASSEAAATAHAQSKVGPQDYNLALDNCGSFTGEVLETAGIQVLTLTPSLLNWNFRVVPHLGGALVNTAPVDAAIRAKNEQN
jgi:hypothetical protein